MGAVPEIRIREPIPKVIFPPLAPHPYPETSMTLHFTRFIRSALLAH